jgi:hypothetical protein
MDVYSPKYGNNNSNNYMIYIYDYIYMNI